MVPPPPLIGRLSWALSVTCMVLVFFVGCPWVPRTSSQSFGVSLVLLGTLKTTCRRSSPQAPRTARFFIRVGGKPVRSKRKSRRRTLRWDSFLYDSGQAVHVVMVISTLVASCALDMCWRHYGEVTIACRLLSHRIMVTLLSSGVGVDWTLRLSPSAGEASPRR